MSVTGTTVRPCGSCNAVIYFKANSEGKWVPFDASGDNKDLPHFQACGRPPRPSVLDVPLSAARGKISAEAASRCRKLTERW